MAGRQGFRASSGATRHRRVRGATALGMMGFTVLLAGTASALSIGPGAFVTAQPAETFEGLTLGPNVGAATLLPSIPSLPGIVLPAIIAPYAFASGVTVGDAGTNPGLENNGYFVHDFSISTGSQNGWGANGTLNSAAQVPFSDAYLGAFDFLTGATNPVSVELSLPAGMLRVGAYVTGATGATVTLQAYDAFGVLLESRSVGTVPVASWASNFVGLERSEGIHSIVFSGVDFAVAGLSFEEPPIPVPEPDTLLLLGLGLVMLARERHR